MFFAITAFVLAIGAVLVAGAVLIIFVRARMTQRRIYSSWVKQLDALKSRLGETSNAKLGVEVADLAAAVEKLARSMRSQFGTINGKLGALEQAPRPEEPASDGERPTRAQLRATYLRPPLLGEKE